MDFRVLGPLEVREGDRALKLGGYRQQLVLAVLLLHPESELSADFLIDAVWGEDPPAQLAKPCRRTCHVCGGLLERV